MTDTAEALIMDRLASGRNINSTIPAEAKTNNSLHFNSAYNKGGVTDYSDLKERVQAWKDRYGGRIEANKHLYALRENSATSESTTSDEPANEATNQPAAAKSPVDGPPATKPPATKPAAAKPPADKPATDKPAAAGPPNRRDRKRAKRQAKRQA
jgi:hypothetical protein